VREEADVLEGQGIRKARETAAAADLCLWVLDAAAEPVWPGPEMGAVRLVVNKVDLAPAWDLERAGDAPHVSAQTGAGLPGLCNWLARWLVPEPPPAGAAVPFTPAIADRVEEASRYLAAGRREEARRALATDPTASGKC
jgi:tRNA modification GTPase